MKRPPTPRRAAWRLLPPLATLCAVAVLLPGCGSGDDTPPPVQISGVVADGPLQGATVCYDLNDNGACDLPGEPSDVTDADGKYDFAVDAAVAGTHAVLADVPATAIDKDTNAPIGARLLLKAPATGSAAGGAQSVFVSPLTTAVAELAAANGMPVAEAAARVQAQLGLAGSPLADFTAPGAPADLGAAARAVGRVMIDTTTLAAAASVAPAATQALVREAAVNQLPVLAAALAAQPAGATPAERNAAAAAAVAAALNLTPATVAAVAAVVAAPAGPVDPAGPFISVRRFAYTDAGNYSYVLFTGDSSATAVDGSFIAHEVRRNMAGGSEIAFARNQMYWTGSDWLNCNDSHQVIKVVQPGTAARPQVSRYCGAVNESHAKTEDIGGQPMRAVIERMRAYPQRDSVAVGAGTDATGLPVAWGPDPALLPADARFPAGSIRNWRSTSADIGGTDRIELAVKPTVRFADGVFRQATSLEQLSQMGGNLADAALVVSNQNSLFLADVAMASQSNAALESFKRWRLAVDVAGLKGRFFECDVVKANNTSRDCAARGDATLAIQTQGGIRLLRVASGYPAAVVADQADQRFWAEQAGTVFRGTTDLPRTRYDQRINGTAWVALRDALGIPAHTDPAAPVEAGPFELLRNFSFTDAANFSWRKLSGDNSQLDANGSFTVSESRRTLAGGADRPFVRNRTYWTGSAWMDCPDAGPVVVNKAAAPYTSTYCQGYVDDRTALVTVGLAGRLMRDVLRDDIRSYNQTDGGVAYSSWGPNPNVHNQLGSLRFPAGAMLDYRGSQPTATPEAINTAASNRVRLPLAGAPFEQWPIARTLVELIAAYPGSLLGAAANGGNTLVFREIDETPTDPLYTGRVEYRVAFDPAGNKARFTRNNRLASNNVSSNYSVLLDTTYTVEQLGDVRLMRFAALPADFETRFGYAFRLAERGGQVWYAFKDRVSPVPTYSVRLNQTATNALFDALGIARPN